VPVIDHTHTYIRNRKHNQYYRCKDPKCSHTCDRNNLEGKASICNACGNEFILTWYDLRLAKPVCIACSGTAKGKTYRAVQSMLENNLNATPMFSEKTENDEEMA